jgi:heme/copper-type cytochrome/quinol oxidase subunit 2
MRGWIYVHTAEEYAKWAAQNLTAATPAPALAEARPADKPDEPRTAELRREGRAKP